MKLKEILADGFAAFADRRIPAEKLAARRGECFHFRRFSPPPRLYLFSLNSPPPAGGEIASGFRRSFHSAKNN